MNPPYDSHFYDAQVPGSEASARIVLPSVFERFQPRSVVDVGCGVGTWAAVAVELGITNVVGVDGDYVDATKLKISPDRFVSADLCQDFLSDEAFDLAICLEVAEHLPETAAAPFIHRLCRLAPIVLFSAAIPQQGGTHHLNEQWPSYWVRRFQDHQFTCFDILRPKFWDERLVERWYRQNMLLFVRSGTSHHQSLSKEFASVTSTTVMNLVHPEVFEFVRNGGEVRVGSKAALRNILRALPGAVIRATRIGRSHR